ALFPVGVVEVLDEQSERRAERAPLAHAAEDLHAIALDLHPAAAAEAELPPRELAVDGGGLEGKARGKALQDAEEGRPVALPGGEVAKASHPAISRERAGCSLSTSAGGAVTPVQMRSCSAAWKRSIQSPSTLFAPASSAWRRKRVRSGR